MIQNIETKKEKIIQFGGVRRMNIQMLDII